MPVVQLTVGDTGPPIEAWLTDGNGAPYDLTGKTYAFTAKRDGVTTLGGAAQLAPNAVPQDGHVMYIPSTADTAIGHVGWHEAKWHVIGADGGITSFPTEWEEPLRVHISAY